MRERRNHDRGSRHGVPSTVCLGLLVIAPIARAEDARQIVEEAQRRSQASSQRYEGVLQVIGSKGPIAEKRWRYVRLGSHGSSKVTLRFTAPPELKGVALRVVNHRDRASEQWLWTPATARLRRIALDDRSTRFLGTDFSFEDLEERDVDQYEYRLLGEEAVDGAPCWRIEARPESKKASQYTSLRLWIRKDLYAIVQAEGRAKDEAVRRFRSRQLERVTGIWTPRVLEVTDLRRKSTTILRMEKIEYNVPMAEADFSLQSLKGGP
jgi:hypothetical protein